MIVELSELFTALHSTNGKSEISKELYWHFLEVLPPKDMGIGWFLFQEGDGDLLRFTEEEEKYFCEAELLDLCADDWSLFVKLKSKGSLFVVQQICGVGDDLLDDEQMGFVGTMTDSPAALAKALGVTFRV